MALTRLTWPVLLVLVFFTQGLGAQAGIDPIRQVFVAPVVLGSAEGQTAGPQASPAQAALVNDRMPVLLGATKGASRRQSPAPQAEVPPPPAAIRNRFTTFAEIRSQVTVTAENDPSWGPYIIGELKGPTEIWIAGVAMTARGPIYFHEASGRVSHVFDLDETVDFPTRYGPVKIGVWASFDEEGQLTFVCPSFEDRTFQIGPYSIPYARARTGYYNKIFFHSNGAISDIHIAEPVRLRVGAQTLLFASHDGCGGDVKFDREGRFLGGYLGEASRIEGNTYPAGAYVQFWPDGRLRAAMGNAAVWSRPVTVGTLRIGTPERGGGVTFTPSGQIDSVMAFSEPTTLYGQRFSRGQSMNSWDTGSGRRAAAVWALGPEDPFFIIRLDE